MEKPYLPPLPIGDRAPAADAEAKKHKKEKKHKKDRGVEQELEGGRTGAEEAHSAEGLRQEAAVQDHYDETDVMLEPPVDPEISTEPARADDPLGLLAPQPPERKKKKKKKKKEDQEGRELEAAEEAEEVKEPEVGGLEFAYPQVLTLEEDDPETQVTAEARGSDRSIRRPVSLPGEAPDLDIHDSLEAQEAESADSQGKVSSAHSRIPSAQVMSIGLDDIHPDDSLEVEEVEGPENEEWSGEEMVRASTDERMAEAQDRLDERERQRLLEIEEAEFEKKHERYVRYATLATAIVVGGLVTMFLLLVLRGLGLSCSHGYYRSTGIIKSCERCPETMSSFPGSEGLDSCFCRAGYYRNHTDGTGACIQCDYGLWAASRVSYGKIACQRFADFWDLALPGWSCRDYCSLVRKRLDSDALRTWEAGIPAQNIVVLAAYALNTTCKSIRVSHRSAGPYQCTESGCLGLSGRCFHPAPPMMDDAEWDTPQLVRRFCPCYSG